MKKLMLYYHFPFCLSKCAYCAFFSKAGIGDETVEEYTKALISQTEGFPTDGIEVTSVYFGGGTPTVAGEKRLCEVLGAVKKRFSLSENAEITVEANPKTVSANGLRALRKAGFNRLSIGAQSFNDGTLKLLERPHNAADFVRCFEDARNAGFDNISADLIFALPGESTDMLMHSVRSLIELKPEHISVYGLSVEEGTPLWRKKESLSFPDEEEEERQYFLLCEALAKAGYSHYEISNFARPGYESRHNTGYWKRTPYFGFGAGAHSFYENRRFSSPCDIDAYIRESSHGCFAPTGFSSAAEISEAEAVEERIMLGLRLSEGVRIDGVIPPELTENGLAALKNGRVCLTEKGFRVSNAIIALFI